MVCVADLPRECCISQEGHFRCIKTDSFHTLQLQTDQYDAIERGELSHFKGRTAFNISSDSKWRPKEQLTQDGDEACPTIEKELELNNKLVLTVLLMVVNTDIKRTASQNQNSFINPANRTVI